MHVRSLHDSKELFGGVGGAVNVHSHVHNHTSRKGVMAAAKRVFQLVVIASAVFYESLGLVSGIQKPQWSNSWSVEIAGGEERANELARKHGLVNMGKVSSDNNTYTVHYDECKHCLGQVIMHDVMHAIVHSQSCASQWCAYVCKSRIMCKLRPYFSDTQSSSVAP